MEVMIVHSAGDSSYRSSMIRAIIGLTVMKTGGSIIIEPDPNAKEVTAVDEIKVLQPADITIDNWLGAFSKKYIRKITALDLVDIPSEIKYENSWNYHHDYNLTAPTVAFDRKQQRRKALAKQHFVKPMKKAKKREKTHVKVSWR